MDTNVIPTYDLSDRPTGCCPRFDPKPWQDQELHLDKHRFVRAQTRSVLHVPVNMGKVFTKTMQTIHDAHAEGDHFMVLSHDDSPWHAEHLFWVEDDVPGAEMVELSGTFLAHVFEGPYKDANLWAQRMSTLVQAKGRQLEKLYFFYTTCPKCAKVYGKNYVVGIAQVS